MIPNEDVVASNGCYYGDDGSKAVAVPVAQGYVVYQTCLAPPPGSDGPAPSPMAPVPAAASAAAAAAIEADMKNLRLIPAPADIYSAHHQVIKLNGHFTGANDP